MPSLAHSVLLFECYHGVPRNRVDVRTGQRSREVLDSGKQTRFQVICVLKYFSGVPLEKAGFLPIVVLNLWCGVLFPLFYAFFFIYLSKPQAISKLGYKLHQRFPVFFLCPTHGIRLLETGTACYALAGIMDSWGFCACVIHQASFDLNLTWIWSQLLRASKFSSTNTSMLTIYWKSLNLIQWPFSSLPPLFLHTLPPCLLRFYFGQVNAAFHWKAVKSHADKTDFSWVTPA